VEIAAWLRELGLERYARAFRDNAIADDVLVDLTDADLEKLGVVLGDRKRMLRSIAALRAAAANPRPPDPTARAATPESAHLVGPAAERRRLTVMFADLVGSTALASRTDPEDLRDVIRAYQDVCAGAVGHYDGHVAKFMGDGVLAYFGYPRAHEDDAERAVRAGLDMAAAVGRLVAPDGTPLAARIGIATGQVVVGDLVGEGAAREEAVVGETPNLAARLQALAEPGTVVIAEATRRLVGELFALRPLGARSLKGFGQPASIYLVGTERPAASRFDARQHGGPSSMVGRDRELALLLDRWRRARAGEGQSVLLVGEAGIGKSRIARALRDALQTESYVALRYQCSPHHADTALWPVIQQLGFAAGFSSGDSATTKLEKLEPLLRRAVADTSEAAPLIAALLGIDAGSRYPPLRLTPQAQRARTLAVLVEQLIGLARREPVLMVVEDAHWIDPTTLELIEKVLDRIAQKRVLLLLTTRPDNQPALGAHPRVMRLTLNRLGRAPTEEIVAGLTGGRTLPREILERIVEETDGVPLFVEELTKAVLDSGLLRQDGDVYALAAPLPALAVPATLHDSLMARLDRVPGVKEVAQTAACIGREFSHALLAAVAPMPEPELRAALDRLAAGEIVFRRGDGPETDYVFKHALVRDAAYESMLKSHRQKLHARIVEAIERCFPGIAEAQPEILAHHCTDAGLAEKAIGYWREAGERAVRRAANREAIGHFHRALALLEAQPEGPARAAAEIKVLSQLGPALMLVEGWAALEAERVYERARRLAGELESSADLVPPLVGLWLFRHTRGEFSAALEATQELFRVVRPLDDPGLMLQAHHAAWPTPMVRGEFTTAREHIAQGLALYDEERHRHHAFLYLGHDPAVCAHALGALTVWMLGHLDQATRHATAAVGLAEHLGHAPSLAHALWFSCKLHAVRGDAAEVLALSGRLLALSKEHQLTQPRIAGMTFRGWALARTGRFDEGFEQLCAGLDAWRRSGARAYLPHRSYLAADVCAAAGRRDEALRLLEDALAIGAQTGERWYEAELHRRRGELLLAQSQRNEAEAEACFRRAITVAGAQQAASLELRAATSLARLWQTRDKPEAALDLLAPVYDRFTEGFETAELIDARALLDAMRVAGPTTPGGSRRP